MDAQEATFEQILALEDEWTGEGRAEYPSIPTFRYREALTFQAVPGQPRLFFLQRSQKKDEAGEWVESHWESGFLRVLGDGALEWLDAQSGGRVEVLRGILHANDSGFVLDFKSKLVANDERMRETARQLTLHGDTLGYRMDMSMTQVPALTLHLQAELSRYVDQAELRQRLEARRAELLGLIGELPREVLTTPRALGDWSVKDLVAHLIAHEQRVLEELNAARNGKRDVSQFGSNDDFNARAVYARQRQSFDQVRAEWDASFNQVLAAVDALNEADFDPFSPLCKLLEDTIDGALANNTYAHYAEHRAGLAEFIRERRSGG